MIAEIRQHPNFVSFNYNGRRMLYEKITSSIYRGEGVKINALEKELQAQTYSPRYDPEPFIAFCNNKKIESIVLNVTEACNFRCKYCIYSGLYKGERTHSFKSMNLDTALKSLDVLLPHTSDLLVVSFYGGEPLLNFNLIKAVTEYLDKNLKGSSKKLVYSLTTNGSLLARHLDFLIEKEFQIAVSIDGPKALHDSRRLYVNGRKSFDDVYSNIELLISKHPEFSKK
ncbi:radical SAM protein, partial [Candidatus Woesearchaeota archaeon]|nr:radical SAM protein [Candidatus Woesearchaeota archaeon]